MEREEELQDLLEQAEREWLESESENSQEKEGSSESGEEEREADNEQETSSEVTEIVLQDMKKNLLWIHPNQDTTKFTVALQPRFHGEVGVCNSLDQLCLSIIRVLIKSGQNPLDRQFFYESHDNSNK